MFGLGRRRKAESEASAQPVDHHQDTTTVTEGQTLGKTNWKNLIPVIACGAGLFSDGYINNVIGSVVTILDREYEDIWKSSNAKKYVGDIAFAGTVVGMLLFGYLSDKWSRTNSLLVSTIILIAFAALAAGSYYKGDTVGMFNILTAWRFFVSRRRHRRRIPRRLRRRAENTGELKSGQRNMWFILFTNSMIDWGFVIGAFVPYVVSAACDNKHLSTIWRTSLGIGVVFPPRARNSMKHARTPYKLVLKFYGFRLFIVSLIWFIYDFSAYSFGIYSPKIVANIYPSGSPLTTIFGWNTVINLFYIPGTMLGAPVSDLLGPRYALALGVFLQAIVGFIMAACYSSLAQPSRVAAFAVVYGIFQSLGELGPGNNIGLIAAKTCATGIRGQYYGLAAAVGKIGAFVGTWVFPYIEKAGGGDERLAAQYPFWDTIQVEDARFRAFLEENGYDTRQLGLRKGEDMVEDAEEVMPVEKKASSSPAE
ncbi:unnamed protein product [Sordaria macrospora k-hell]|uniref:WGS project CABT00000000 data, contig 2.10 n=1 Tax=Sordaria macrospora (strain ATCC MYA-333 / DSM 997 / K(L3346) / K-hell) TaxID=771870 RepID=F7VW58_SORMK|nr:uncharacterized protein SMAC_03436 [Sordaria macrospora k-hell]CCC09880.1 unnamed protein product [Sordaria macrospora k-hell]